MGEYLWGEHVSSEISFSRGFRLVRPTGAGILKPRPCWHGNNLIDKPAVGAIVGHLNFHLVLSCSPFCHTKLQTGQTVGFIKEKQRPITCSFPRDWVKALPSPLDSKAKLSMIECGHHKHGWLSHTRQWTRPEIFPGSNCVQTLQSLSDETVKQGPLWADPRKKNHTHVKDHDCSLCYNVVDYGNTNIIQQALKTNFNKNAIQSAREHKKNK